MEASKRPTYLKHVLESYGPQGAWSQGLTSAEEKNTLIGVVKKDLLKKKSVVIVSISVTVSGWQDLLGSFCWITFIWYKDLKVP